MPKDKWKEENIITAYELARSGNSETSIAKCLGVTPETLQAWKKARPHFNNALKRGKAFTKVKEEKDKQWRDYVVENLPENLRDLWDEIELIDRSKSGVEKLEALIKSHGDRAHQNLFIHALLCSNFRINEALRKSCVCYSTFTRWKETDPDFPALLDYLKELKGNFFEDALCLQVSLGDSPSVIFANRTFNRNRGYGDKITVEANVTTTIQPVKIDELNLPLETRKQLLEKVRERKQIESFVINTAKKENDNRTTK